MNNVEIFVDEMVDRLTNMDSLVNSVTADSVNEALLTYAPNYNGVIGGTNDFPDNPIVGQVFNNVDEGTSWVRINESNEEGSEDDEGVLELDDETDDLIEEVAELERLNVKLYSALEYAFKTDPKGVLEMCLKNEPFFKELWE